MVVEGVTGKVTLEQRLGGGEDGVPADVWGRVHWAEGTARAKALRRGVHGWIPGKESREAAELVL